MPQAQLGDLDHVFTPERIAELDRISAEIKAGGTTYSLAEVQEHFENRRKAWLAAHAYRPCRYCRPPCANDMRP